MKALKIIKEKIQSKVRKNEKLASIIYLIIGFLTIVCLIRQTIHKNYFDVLLCALSLVLITIPSRIEARTKLELPQTLEIIIICFIFSAEILGEIENFYYYIPIWDSLLHITTGCLAAAVGFSAIDLINTHVKRISMTPFFVIAIAFCFSMTIGVMWEFFEYGADTIMRTDMQKDAVVSSISTVSLDRTNTNTSVLIDHIHKTVLYDANGNEIVSFDGYLDIGIQDTMKDLFVNMLGALVFSIYGYLYLKKREKYKFIESIIIKEKECKV